MKKIFSLFIAGLLMAACSDKNSQSQEPAQQPQQQTVQTAPTIDTDTVFSFDINTLTSGCDNESQIICAINMTVKCTINPHFEDCAAAKSSMPSFVFMEDESLQRPTSQSYKITKIKPLPGGQIEVYTQSTCNGNWFGLCNGNIIYVLEMQDDSWVVKDLYAVEA